MFNNTSGGQYGVGLDLLTVAEVVVTNLKAISNTGVNRGVVCINAEAGLVLKNSLFQENACFIGAAIYGLDSISLIATNTVFRGNTASQGEGGGIYFNPRPKPSARFTIRSCTFESN